MAPQPPTGPRLGVDCPIGTANRPTLRGRAYATRVRRLCAPWVGRVRVGRPAGCARGSRRALMLGRAAALGPRTVLACRRRAAKSELGVDPVEKGVRHDHLGAGEAGGCVHRDVCVAGAARGVVAEHGTQMRELSGGEEWLAIRGRLAG